MTDEKIKNSRELEFAVFCIENVAAKLGVDAERVYQAFTEKSNILNGYIVPEYEVLHTQSREYIVNDLLDVMKERGRGKITSPGKLPMGANYGAYERRLFQNWKLNQTELAISIQTKYLSQ